MDHESLLRAKQLVRNHQGTDRVLACPAASVANDVRVAFGKSGKLGWIKTGIHACQDMVGALRADHI